MTIGGASLILHIQYTWLDYYVWIRCLKCWKISGTRELTWVRRVLLVQMIRYRFPVIHWLIQNIWEQGIENNFDLFTATCEIESNKVHLLMKQMWNMCQVQWMNEEQKLQWPKLRPLGDVGIAVEKKSSDSIRLKAGDFASAKFAESIGETHSLFFLNGGTLLISLSASDFLVRKQIGSLFFEDQLSCKRPFEPPEAARETWLGVQMMFSYCWSLHNMGVCTTQ